jgi:hypothetical protein
MNRKSGAARPRARPVAPIDDRGRELSKPDIDPDRAAELRLANLRDFEDIARFLARLRLLEKDAPTGINWRRQRFVGVR